MCRECLEEPSNVLVCYGGQGRPAKRIREEDAPRVEWSARVVAIALSAIAIGLVAGVVAAEMCGR